MKYNTTPAENTSHFSVYPYSLSTSGAMKPGVPDSVYIPLSWFIYSTSPRSAIFNFRDSSSL